MNRFTLAKFAALLLSGSLLGACSFSTSSESAFDSSKGLFDSASSSFASSSDSSGDAKEKYESDVADYTADFVTSSSGTLDSFRVRLGELAEKHAITDWENDRYTYLGIGRGLRQAKLGKPQISAFSESLSRNDPMKKQAIEDGLKK
ncbi:putative lipoprotein [Methylomonas koyamae]|uniref:putative lipoprotein n=1 Tax=Methylomonas koyamae TaxID=702114 RepID=UPI00287329A1|nr:putative lipoprotein [Methylomonas koyamae]WNB74504.1 putative lipoprotein [Methylomonas koyamae]